MNTHLGALLLHAFVTSTLHRRELSASSLGRFISLKRRLLSIGVVPV